MSDPNGFVSFADYLGLNDEAGDQMAQRALGSRAGELGDIQATADAHFKTSHDAGAGVNVGEWNRLGEATRTGLASYAEFMEGMQDPAKRQALLEKTYGRGAVSWLDSAVAGAGRGGGQIRGAQQSFDKFGREVDQQEHVTNQEWSNAARAKTQGDARDLAARNARQAEVDRQQAQRAKMDADRAARIRARQGKEHFGQGYSEGGGFFGAGLFGQVATQGEYMDRMLGDQKASGQVWDDDQRKWVRDPATIKNPVKV